MLSATGKDPATPTNPPTLTWNYAYDGMGNRTSATKPSGTGAITYTLDGQGWPVADDSAGGGTKYAYDAVGDLTFIDRDGATTTNDWTYVYDAWSRTTQAKKGLPTAPSLTLDYKIDALGRMQRRTAGAPFIDYSYEGVSETPAKATPSSGSASLYSNTPGGPLAQKVGAATAQILLRDLHGDVVGAATANGTTVANQTRYSAWGERTGSSSDLGYQGQRTDPSTDQIDMLTRMYSPSTGRFSTRDALGGVSIQPSSLNQFAYAEGGPVTHTDSTGMCLDENDHVVACTQVVKGLKTNGPRDTSTQGGTYLPPDDGPLIDQPNISVDYTQITQACPGATCYALSVGGSISGADSSAFFALDPVCGCPVLVLGGTSLSPENIHTGLTMGDVSLAGAFANRFGTSSDSGVVFDWDSDYGPRAGIGFSSNASNVVGHTTVTSGPGLTLEITHEGSGIIDGKSIQAGIRITAYPNPSPPARPQLPELEFDRVLVFTAESALVIGGAWLSRTVLQNRGLSLMGKRLGV
jgi:RHS repeat-associated protein